MRTSVRAGTARVTVVLGNVVWQHPRQRVRVDYRRRVVEIHEGDGGRHVATAPLSAAYVEWLEPPREEEDGGPGCESGRPA